MSKDKLIGQMRPCPGCSDGNGKIGRGWITVEGEPRICPVCNGRGEVFVEVEFVPDEKERIDGVTDERGKPLLLGVEKIEKGKLLQE